VLLGSALAAGVLSLPAHAQSYQDTGLSATQVATVPFGGTSLSAANNTGGTGIDLTGTNVTWSLHGAPAGVGLSGNTVVCSACTANPSTQIVADATDSHQNVEALVIDVVITASTIQKTSAQPTTVTVTGLADTDNSIGTVTFTTTSSGSTFVESNLPTGLTSGGATLTYAGGTAAPGTYTGVKVTATDSDGAAQIGTFTLTVSASTVTSNGTTGDEVNKFGYGFDSYRQHDYAGAIIVGWTATSSDPATQFLMNNGSHSGYYQFEYAPNGSGSGLCMSDPGGGWGSDPLRDGLILANCNSGPFQQFFPESDGTLVNLETGLIIDPAGKGGQLRGGSSAVGWGGSSYTWESGE
jgi:hypothetical protein